MKQNLSIPTTNQIQQSKTSGGTSEEERLRHLMALHPEEREPYLLLGDLLHRAGNPEEAIDVYRQALSTDPSWGEVYHNLGNALLALRRFPEALQAYNTVSHLLPGFAECHVTAATALQAMGCPHEALDQCNRALKLDPLLAEAHWNRALLLLQFGEYTEGWREFSWRWQKRGYTTPYRHFPQPQWQGEPLAGRTILIHAEQAFGDTIMFSRFIPLVAAQGGQVVCECPEPLVRLMSGVTGVSSAVAAGTKLPRFDCHIPLLSLPLIFATTLDTIPTTPTWLKISRHDITPWQQHLSHYSGLRVGIVWAGRPFPDPARSCPFTFLAPLGTLDGVMFVSLQIGTGAEDAAALAKTVPLVDVTGEITDFADTAALIQCLDLVITIDSAVAHLSGTLGVPTWVMLPFAADWRWLLNRDDSPWYPAMRLFRQRQADDWSELISRVRAALIAQLSTKALTSFESFYERGVAALQRCDLEEAWLLLERARSINADVPEVYNALGVLATKENDAGRAEQLLIHASHLDPGYTDPLINLGNIMYEAGRDKESANLLLRVIEIEPDAPKGWLNLGVVLQGFGKIEEAFNCFRRALELKPDYATVRWNLSNLELLTGDYENGWRDFEARFTKTEPIAMLHGEILRWNGSPLMGKTILVHAEQGYGDTIQFVRYLPLLHRLGGRVIFEVPDSSLLRLMENLVGVDRISVRGETVPVVDYQVPLLSVPGILGTRPESIPHEMPYLVPAPLQVAAWSKQTADKELFHVGLCWAGRPKPDPRRSCRLATMAPLAKSDRVIFHSLQMGTGSEQTTSPPIGMHLRDDTGQITDFADTAALICNLDLVITVDSAVAHLAGALGKPVWLLLPFAPDWRWMLGREDSLWYPSMRLFRQTKAGNWNEVMERVAAELDTTVATYHGRPLRGFV